MTASGDPTESLRYRDARDLALLQAPVVFEKARGLLADDSWRVRRAAWEALAKAPIDPAQRIAFLLDCLEDPDDPRPRGAALDALIQEGRAAMPWLIEALPGRNPRGRKFILDIFAQVADKGALSAAAGLLDDEDDNIRFAAAEVVGRAGGLREAEALLSRLGRRSADSFALLMALAAIVRRQPLSISAALLEPFLSDRVNQTPAYELLGLAGDEAAGPLLWDSLAEGKSVDQVLLALQTYFERHPGFQPAEPGSGLRILLARIEEPSGCPLAVQQAIFELIAVLEPGRLRKVVIPLLKSDPEWLAVKLHALPAALLPGLLTTLTSDEAGCTVAARILGRRPELEGESMLLALLNRPGAHRTETLLALGMIGSARSAPHLAALCGEEAAPELADGASQALFQVAGRDDAAAAGLLRLIGQAKPEMLIRLLPALGRAGLVESATQIAAALRHPDAGVRRAAVHAAPRLIADPDIETLLLARLSDEVDEVRAAAAVVLGEAGILAAAAPLGVLLDDPSPWVQASALRALAALGTPPDAERLMTLLLSGGIVGAETAVVLGRHISAQCFAPILETLADIEAETVAELIRSFGAYPDDLPPDHLGRLLAHAAWPIRVAAVQYIGVRARPWMLALAEERRIAETDELVRLRLDELARG